MLLPSGPSPRPRPGSSDAQATRSDRVGRARHGVAIPARLAATAAALAALLASPARAQTASPALFITNGQVTAQALRDSTLYIGGSFTFVGPVTGAGVPVDSVSALPGPGFPRVNGVVLAAVPDGAGGWFIGGQFTAVDGSLRSNLAHVLADFTVAAWDPGASGIVRALVLRGGTLFVGGDFLTLGGAARNRIGAVDTSTALATAWNPNANSSVRAFAPGTSALYVGGQFTAIGGLARNRIAALDYVTGAASAAWNPNANGTVLSLSLDPASNLLYAGGQFTFFDVLRRNRIAQIDAPTGSVTDWNAGCDNAVFAVVASGGQVYTAGQFTLTGGQTRNRIAALDGITGLATPWNPGADNIVQALAVSGSTVYVGGDFLSAGGQARSRVAALDAATGLATAWNPTAYGTVSALATAGTQVFVGGSFNGIGGVPRSNLAAFDTRTGQVTGWDPNADSPVQALLALPDRVIAGGNFAHVGGQPRTGLAAVDTAAGLATAWAPGCNGQVFALALAGNRLYVGGVFTSLGGQARSDLGAVDANTGLAQAWTADADGPVFAIDAGGPQIYVGGNFTTLAGTQRNFVGALDVGTGAATPWVPDASASVRAIVATCGRVYLGGAFTSVGGQFRNHVAAVDPVTGLAQPWNPGANGIVFTLLVRPGAVYLGGLPNVVGGVARNRIASVDPLTGAVSAWNPNSNGTVRSLVADSSNVYIGGVFSTMNGAPTGNLASVPLDTSIVCPAIGLSPPPLPAAVAGSAYVAAITAAGGTAPYCYAVSAGALPDGLLLDPGTGSLSGAPTAAGLATFSVTSTDAHGCTGTETYSITTTWAPGLSIVVQPSSVVAGVAIAPGVRAHVADDLGTSLPGAAISLGLVGSGVLAGGGAIASDADGVAVFSALSVNLVGAKQLVAASGAIAPDTSLAFVVSPAAPAALAFVSQPANAVAGVAIAPAVRVKVTDAFGNAILGAPVSLALVGTGTLTGGGAVVTDSTGIASFVGLSVDLAGSKQLTASSGTLTSVTSTAFAVSPAAAASLAFTVQPSNVVAGVAVAPAVQIKVADAFGNGVPGTSVSLALVGTGTLTGGGAASSNASGIASFAGVSINLVGSKQLTASSGTLPSVTSAAFTVSPAAAASLAFAAQPTNVVAGVSIAPAVQVKVSDAFGNAVPGTSVSLALVGTGTLTGGGAVVSDANGNASFAGLSINLAGGKQLTASSGALPSVTSTAFTVSPAAAASLAFTVQPSNVVAGVAIAPAVQIKVADAFGNGVPGTSVSLALVGTGTLTGGGAAMSDASGNASFAGLSINLAGSKQLTAASGTLSSVTSTAFTVSPAAAASLAFTVQPSNVVAGVAIAPAVQVKVTDAFGNGVAGSSVSLALVGTGTLTGGGAVVSNASGNASFAGVSINLAGGKQLTVSSGALPSVTSTAFTVSPAAAASLGFTIQPTNVVAGVAIAPAVLVRVADAFGNAVPGTSVSLALVGTGTLTGGGAGVSDASGNASFAGLSINLAGSKQLTASSGTLPSVTSTAFTVSPAAAASLAFTVQPSSVVAGVAIAPAVQVKVSDAFGNAVPGTSVSLALVGTGTLTGGAAVVSNASGNASFAGVSINLAGGKQLTASSGALPSATSTAFTVSPGAAASLAFTVQPSSVTAGVAIAPAVQIKVADAFGNGVAGSSVSLALVGAGTLTGGGAVVSNASGIASFAGLSINLVGSKQLTASSGTLPSVTSTAFTVSPAAAASLAFTVQPSNVVAGVAIAPAVQVKVSDAFGNAVAGGPVSLALVGTGTLTGGGAASSDANGVVSYSGLGIDLAGSKQLTASSATVPSVTSAAFTVSPAAAASLAFTVQPSSVVAGVAIAPAAQIKVADAFGNGVPGASVSLALVGTGTLSGGGAVVSDASGIARFAGVSINLAGSKQLTASSGALPGVTSAAFTVSPAAAASLAFAAQPTDVVAGVAIAPAVRVRVVDGFGNAVSGSSVSLALVGAGTLTGGGAAVSDASGNASFAGLSINLAGSKQVTASSGALPSVTSTAFTVSPAAAASLAFTVQPTNVVAGVAIAPAVQIKVADAFGNGVAGTSVSLALVGTGTLTGGGAVVSDASGIASYSSLSINLAGSKQFTASSGALPSATSTAFTVSPAAAASLAFTVQPSNVVAGVAIAPAVLVRVADAFGNAVPGTSVSLALVGAGTLTGGGAGVSDASGNASFAGLSINLVGSKQLTASSGALPSVTSAAFTVSPAAAASLAFTVQPTNVVAGVSVVPAVQVQARDAFTNPVPGASVALALVGTGALTGGAGAATNASGIASFAGLSIDLAGSKQLTAACGAAPSSTSATFTVSPAAAATLAFVVQPTNAVAGVAIAPAVQVKVADAFGNGVPGTSVSLALVGAGTLTGGGAASTDAGGIATFSGLSVDVAGSKQLTASSGALPSVTSASFGVSSAAAASLAFFAPPSDAVAGVTISPPVRVRVADAFGNAVAGAPVSLALAGTGTLTGGAATVSDAGGLASFPALSIDVAGSKQLAASSGALPSVTSAAFTVSPAAAASLAFAAQPSDVVAGGAIAPAVQVQVSDAFGNGTPGVLVSLGLVGGGTLTAGGAASTNASGIVTFSGLSIDLAGSKQLTASSGSLPQATSAAFTVSPAAAASLAFVVQPTNVTAGAAITPAVQLKVSDAFGNGVAGTPVSLALVGTGTLTGGSAVSTDAAGFASFAGLRIDVAGSKQLAASSGALPGVTSGSFSVSPGAAASISFATQPSDVASGAAIAPAVRVRVSDPLGNGVPSAPVSLALLGTGALAGGGATATDAQGIASFPSLVVKGGGSKQLAATSGALPGVNSAAFVVSCPAITLSPVSLPRTGVGLAYTVTLSALGGASPYAFVVTAGTLPAGLTLSAGGTLSGTPTGGGTSSFSVTATDANACQGAQACSVTVLDAPAAVADLTAHRLDTGNGSDGRARILLTWSPPPAGTVEVYRAPFGGYPRYDDAGGKTPATPAYPPGAPWETTAVTGSGQTDKPLTRDAWSYVAFVRNDVGQVSPVSNCTPAATDYILGDVSNHADQGFGDGIVDEADLSLMGAHYGIEGNRIVLENVRYLDVGPTTDSSPRSRPVTDGRIDFEDLFMVALNFHLTVAPASAIALGDPSAPERFELRAPSLAAAGETFDVVLGVQAEGRIQGLTAQLDWDASVAQPISVAGSAWLEAQQGVVLSAGPGDIDAVLLGLRAQGLTGSGDVATVRFRALRTGDPRIRLSRLDARDGANHALDPASVQIEARTAAPAQTLLFAPVPNPTHGPAQVSFALARAGRVDLAVYSVDGRRVRTLAGGPFAPGAYHFDWSGDDDSRHPVAPGVYFTQLVTQERRFSRKLVRLP